MDLQIAMRYKKRKKLEAKDSALSYGSGMLNVLASPAMISFMEECSHKLLLECLSEGQDSVGTEINVKHLKATPIGMKIECKVEVIEIDGKSVLFKVEAWDEKGKIGEGTHQRFIIDVERFMKKINS